ncbi:MAG: YceH family protein [Tibeticola sp.]
MNSETAPGAREAHPVPAQRPLSVAEARVLGTLIEKARTVPDSYPLTLNMVVAGCNQKTSREPVLQLGEAEVQQALDALRALDLVAEAGGARVPHYAHNLQRALRIPEQSAVLLGLLMLRGPQTAAELRQNGERWYRFADVSSVEAFLAELQDRADERGGAVVAKLPRAPGAREVRWMHRLCGEPEVPVAGAPAAVAAAGSALAERVAALEAEVAGLRTQVARLMSELGLSPD